MDPTRQKLVELRDGFDGAAYVETDKYAETVWCNARDSVDAILADWPEGAKVMPRTPDDSMIAAGEDWLIWCHENNEPPEPRSGWINMFDAYNPEGKQ